LFERVTATGSLVIRKLGETRAGELAMHRFLAAASVTCQEMLETLARRTLTAAAGRRIVVAQDTTEINFSGREAKLPSTARQKLFSVLPTRISGRG
jgi:hypothetical protein